MCQYDCYRSNLTINLKIQVNAQILSGKDRAFEARMRFRVPGSSNEHTIRLTQLIINPLKEAVRRARGAECVQFVESYYLQ